jgi:hypothetical protein
MIQFTPGKLTARDEKVARFLNWVSWLSPLLVAFPVPLIFLVLFLISLSTDSAVFYLFFAGITLGIGVIAALVLFIFLRIYRQRWLKRLRDRLAADGITANELGWFTSELTSAEKKTLRETTDQNPLLGDAYRETLAARITASRIIARADQELVKVRSRIRRAHTLRGADTATLLKDLESDQLQLQKLRGEANGRLLETKARLQTIEAAASRSLNETETSSMLRRLTATQEQLPLVIEMQRLERETLHEAERELKKLESADGSKDETNAPSNNRL